MDYSKKKQQLLDKLEAATGITFDITSSTLSDEEVCANLSDMLLHYNILDNKESFYTSFLQGQLATEDITQAIHKFHIDETSIRMLFLLESPHPYSSEVIKLLRSLLPNPTDVILEMDSTQILVIQQFSEAPDNEEISDLAHTFISAIETEAFASFKVAYDSATNNVFTLPSVYKDLVLCMKIGNIFLGNEQTYCFSELGLGRLLFNVPIAECETYLNNQVDIDSLKSLDEETLNTIGAFFDNDLSIAETARQLFLHRNTLIYRIEKFKDTTGLDIRKFSDAITCKIALMIIELLKTKN